MNKIVKNIVIGGTVIGVGAALLKFKKYKKNVLEHEKNIEKKAYELGADDTERKYIKLYEVNKAKIEELSEELEDVKQKKKLYN